MITSSPAHRWTTFGVRKGATRRDERCWGHPSAITRHEIAAGKAIQCRFQLSIKMLIASMRLRSREVSEGTDIVPYPVSAARCVRDDECNHEPATRGQRRETRRDRDNPNDRWPPQPSHHHLSYHSIDHNADRTVLVQSRYKSHRLSGDQDHSRCVHPPVNPSSPPLPNLDRPCPTCLPSTWTQPHPSLL
jgi:hypothetical protein